MDRTTIRYGHHQSQVADLWLPTETDGEFPVVVLLHGGFWRGLIGKSHMNHLATALVENGWAVWNVEYRRIGPGGGGGGGWPHTFVDVLSAIDRLADFDIVDLDRIATCGHSAGGHLALWAAARDRIGGEILDTAPSRRVSVKGAISLAGISNLKQAAELRLGNGSVQRFLGGSPSEIPDQYHAASPFALLPLGVPQYLIHGLDDQYVPPEMSESYAERAKELGDNVSYLSIPGYDHHEVRAVPSTAFGALVSYLAKLFV